MSDVSMYEFEDIAWDEFCQSDDHIVPQPGGERASEQSSLVDSCKKPRRELVGFFDNARDRSASKNGSKEMEQENFSVVNNRRRTMLEKDSWSQTANGVHAPSCDSNSVKELSSIASETTRKSGHCSKINNVDCIGSEFCGTDAILNDKSAAVDSNSYDYPLDHISQTDNDLSFFVSNRDDKDSGDFLYYGWPDIGNFEDVDRIFRSCDSTFGLGASNEDDLGWFSSSDAVEGTGDALKPELKFSCPDANTMEDNSENPEPLRIDDTCSINDTSMKDEPVSYRNSSWPSEKDRRDSLGHLSLVNGTGSSGKKGDFMPIKQGIECSSEVQHKIPATSQSANISSGMVNVHKKQPKHQKQSDGKKRDQYLANGVSYYYSNSLPNEDSRMPSEATSCETLSSMGLQQQQHALGSESFGYMQSNIQYMRSDFSGPSDHRSVYPTLSAVKSDNNGFTSVSSKESYASNQVLSAESSRGPLFHATPIVSNEKREKLHHQQVFQSPFNRKSENAEMVVQVPLCNLMSIDNKVQHLGNKFEIPGDPEEVPGELGSLTVQESSSMSSVLDEISLEASSFRQLQLVMEQLDQRTKLCIRDSLYRLARSAEQRHNHANLNGSCCGDDRDTSGVQIAEGSTKCTSFMDMETNTNPIDRSIAHLLFHRPADSSATPAEDLLCHKTPNAIRGSIGSPPVKSEKLVNHETPVAETERNVVDP